MQQRNVLGSELIRLLVRPADRLLPIGVLREPWRRPGPARRVLPGHERVPGVLRHPRQRPRDADAAVRVPRSPARRPVVRVRGPLGRGAGRPATPARSCSRARTSRPSSTSTSTTSAPTPSRPDPGSASAAEEGAPGARVRRRRPGPASSAAWPRAPSRRSPAAPRSGGACRRRPRTPARRRSTSSAGGCRVEQAPDREGDAQVVDHRRPPEQRRPAQGDRRGAGDGVVDRLAGLHAHLRPHAARPASARSPGPGPGNRGGRPAAGGRSGRRAGRPSTRRARGPATRSRGRRRAGATGANFGAAMAPSSTRLRGRRAGGRRRCSPRAPATTPR